MKLVLASRNKKKTAELRSLLEDASFGPVEVLSLDDVGITGEIEETGGTFEENAMIKANAAASCGYIAVADDSGLSVDILGGAPGVYSARYAGEHGDDEKNNEKLLAELKKKGVVGKERSARFISCVACVMPDGRSFTVSGEVRGVILEQGRGENGFGYDPLFYYEPFGKTFAQLSPEEKNLISHRGKAMRAFVRELSARLG